MIMIDYFMGLDKAGKIRLLLFVIVLIWCVYWGAGFSYEISRGGGAFHGLSGSMVDTSDIDDVYIDGSDFTWGVRLLGHAANGAILIVIVLLMLLFMVLVAVATVIPVALLRIFGLKKKYVVTEEEYKLTKYIYLTAIGLSLVLSLILTRFTSIIPSILFTLTWSLVMLIYVLGTWERKKMYEMNE